MFNFTRLKIMKFIIFYKCIESKHFLNYFCFKTLKLKQDSINEKKLIESRIFLAIKFALQVIESRIKSSKKLFCIITFFLLILQNLLLENLHAKNYGGNYDWRMIGGGPLQLVSFHIGTDTSITHSANTGYSIGASVGWNYFSAFYNVLDDVEHTFDVGFRVKYMFNRSAFETHLVGAELYLHFPCATSDTFLNFPQPISLVIGGGGILPYKDSKNFSGASNAANNDIRGYYFEFGIGLAKYFIVNVNFLYRVSFFNADSIKAINNVTFSPQNFNLQPIEHSFHIEFAIL